MKAILVIDMPDTCDDCDLRSFEGCVLTGNLWGERPSDCPLRPLPKRMTANLYYRKTDYVCDWKERSYGWNECLDEILGEEGNNGLKPLPKDESHKYYGCPSCRHIVSSVQNYCENCGQKLDWRDIGETE